MGVWDDPFSKLFYVSLSLFIYKAHIWRVFARKGNPSLKLFFKTAKTPKTKMIYNNKSIFFNVRQLISYQLRNQDYTYYAWVYEMSNY